jgi:hypothetical protein
MAFNKDFDTVYGIQRDLFKLRGIYRDIYDVADAVTKVQNIRSEIAGLNQHINTYKSAIETYSSVLNPYKTAFESYDRALTASSLKSAIAAVNQRSTATRLAAMAGPSFSEVARAVHQTQPDFRQAITSVAAAHKQMDTDFRRLATNVNQLAMNYDRLLKGIQKYQIKSIAEVVEEFSSLKLIAHTQWNLYRIPPYECRRSDRLSGPPQLTARW